jgi:hypothetical protein
MPFDLTNLIEKAITEHGSAAIMRDHLALFRDRAKFIEEENARLKKRVEELEQLAAELAGQLAAAKKKNDTLATPERKTTSGELMVDGILWAYVADNKTGKWLKFAPLCPHCHTELCVSDVSPFLALEPQDRRVQYHCDLPQCGKLDLVFVGNSSDREGKAARHILREHREKKS